MAFERRRIIRALESYERIIPEHVVKIILFPHSREVAHWKNELFAWADYLTKLRLKGSLQPMGAKFAYKYLYDGPFVGNELGMTNHFIQVAELTNQTTLNVDPQQVHDTLKDFLTDLAIAIGQGKDVRQVINSL
ncbi:unnamed protein product [Sphagnum tenellum]